LPARRIEARPIVAAEDVAVIFSDAQVAQLARSAKLPSGANMAALAEGVREATRIFACDARIPNGNELHNEIADLHKASDRHQYDEVATRLGNLSPQAMALLNARLTSGNELELPPAEAMRDPARRDGACQMIAGLCRFGGGTVEGRRRPSGKRSRPTWRPLLYAPEPRTNFAKRDAERDFVMWLSLAWLEATGSAPSRTARHRVDGRDVGPFARFARECLCRVGAADADIVELMNDLHQRRREMERRTSQGQPNINAVK
jgi:hypothetical protein